MPTKEQGSITRSQGTILPDDKWHNIGEAGEPVFTNSWVDYGGIYPPVRFIKDASGVVHIEGLIKTGTMGLAAFTLPAGYRPTGGELIVATTTYNDAVGRLNIEVDGDVIPRAGSNVFFSVWVSFYVG